MNKAEITQAVRILVGKSKLREALKALSDYVKGVDGDLENDLLLQTSSFNGNEKNAQNGLASTDDYERGKARTRYNITQIMGNLPEEGNDVLIETSNTERWCDHPCRCAPRSCSDRAVGIGRAR